MYRVPWLALALALALADLERAVVQADERARPAAGRARTTSRSVPAASAQYWRSLHGDIRQNVKHA